MIKEWFLDKNFSANERYIISLAEESDELLIISETDKAVKFKAVSDFGNIIFWCPKSCIYTDDELAAINARISEKMIKGLEYNELLLGIAKENGVKGVRKGMKTLTLVKKLKENGIEIPERM